MLTGFLNFLPPSSTAKVEFIWIPEIKEYQIQRLSDGAAASTINKEKTALSRIFEVLTELKLADINPARLVKNLSEKSGERQVYLSYEDFQSILELLPAWFQPIALTAFFTECGEGRSLG